jgi:hypothetical protein
VFAGSAGIKIVYHTHETNIFPRYGAGGNATCITCTTCGQLTETYIGDIYEC